MGLPSQEDDLCFLLKPFLQNYQKIQLQNPPLLTQLLNNVSQDERQILTSLVTFNPNKRPTAHVLLKSPFFAETSSQKNHTSKFSNSLFEDMKTPHALSSSPFKEPPLNPKQENKLNVKSHIKSNWRRKIQKSFQISSKGTLRAQIPFHNEQRNFAYLDCKKDWWKEDLEEIQKENLQNFQTLGKNKKISNLFLSPSQFPTTVKKQKQNLLSTPRNKEETTVKKNEDIIVLTQQPNSNSFCSMRENNRPILQHTIHRLEEPILSQWTPENKRKRDSLMDSKISNVEEFIKKFYQKKSLQNNHPPTKVKFCRITNKILELETFFNKR